MTLQAGQYPLGPANGHIVLRTFRQGMAAAVGHDLTIDLTRWSGTITVSGEDSGAVVDARLDLTSLSIREGTGGVKPLTDSDRKDIVKHAGKTLGSDRYPSATFTASIGSVSGDGGEVGGELTLHGTTNPIRVNVSAAGEGQYRGTATIVQSEYGIKPYTGFFGALKVRDSVDVEFDVDLSAGPAAG
jgi:polyisoprenoid-binding protein YceI